MNPMARTVDDAPVFLTVKNLVTCGKVISLVAPNATVEDVTKGVAAIWYADT